MFTHAAALDAGLETYIKFIDSNPEGSMVRKGSLTGFFAACVLALCALALVVANVQAGPPAPVDIVITQPDGTTLTVRQWGDEWQNGLETADGYSLLLDEGSGYWTYAVRQADGQLAPAQQGGQLLRAGIDAPGSLPRHARPAPPTPDMLPQLLANNSSSSIARAPSTGDQKLLVILVEFSNEFHQSSPETFRNLAFGTTNSIKDYYNQASGGMLTYTPATEAGPIFDSGNNGVIDWLKLDYLHPNPATLYGFSEISMELARRALSAADVYVDFKTFDSNGDEVITSNELQILIVAAGCEASGGCPVSANKLWAHQHSLDNNSLTLDGVRVAQSGPVDDGWLYGGYAIVSERHYDAFYGTYQPATIGVMVHELGHLLGWPDLYDVSNASSGVGEWSIMGSGSWNSAGGRPGSRPALPDAWSKWYQGWVTPIQAPAQNLISLNSASTEIFLIGSNPNGVDWDFERTSGVGEYWLLENRQLSGYDAGLPGSGLLLWHIDETATYTNYANNSVVNPYHRLVALEQADGRNDLGLGWNRGDSGDPYPGSTFAQLWGPATNPSSAYNTGEASGFSLKIDLGLFQTYLPVVLEQTPITGQLTSNGIPVAGQTVSLLYTTNAWSSYSVYNSATSDASGNFSLTMPPLLTSQHRYQLYWKSDPDRDRGWLGAFYSNVGTTSTSNHHFPINIADVRLVSPAPGASVSAPTTYTWVKRATSTDSYVVTITDWYADLFVSSELLGYKNQAIISGLPSWVSVGSRYHWFIEVYTPAGSGFSYWMNPIYFKNIAGPALNILPKLDWITGSPPGATRVLPQPRPIP